MMYSFMVHETFMVDLLPCHSPTSFRSFKLTTRILLKTGASFIGEFMLLDYCSLSEQETVEIFALLSLQYIIITYAISDIVKLFYCNFGMLLLNQVFLNEEFSCFEKFILM